MPLVYQQNINDDAKLGVWKIEESEDFFLNHITPQRVINHSKKRLQHLAGRYLLKHMDDSIDLNQVVVSVTGRPSMADGSCFFSISHSNEFVAVIISKFNSVGIDIELLIERSQAVYDKFLSEYEQALLLCTIETKANAYTLGWTIKEAVFKWEGNGMVDFKKQLNVRSIIIREDWIESSCTFQKNNVLTPLKVSSMMLENTVMSWVMH